ncbi:MAG: phosphatidate cytidylyltransferase [Desulfobacteraceae bacterium]|nr:phosphatidate cytidylyltransferase [Desulfobacteraceae bacterium]
MIYIALSLSFLIMIRESPDGMIWIFWILGIIFAGDVGAFYVGRQFGQHKLCPSVSPGKTVEGAIGGILANILLGAVGKFFLLELPWGQSILMAICIGIAGQVGDLFESEFKRTTGVKDSGVILPGHGGVLDRIDALLFAAPVAFLFKKFILA